MKSKTVCFFGHRKIPKNDKLKNKLRDILEDLIINQNVETFLFGSRSEFDELCRDVAIELKEKYPYIHRIYIRAEFPYINERYRQLLLERYDDTYYPERLLNAGKSVYVERNYEMIDKSDICVVYYSEEYNPPRRKNSRRDLFDYQPKSGTVIAYEYAVKMKKDIINLADNVQ